LIWRKGGFTLGLSVFIPLRCAPNAALQRREAHPLRHPGQPDRRAVPPTIGTALPVR
jgi:hypothetical protein